MFILVESVTIIIISYLYKLLCSCFEKEKKKKLQSVFGSKEIFIF